MKIPVKVYEEVKVLWNNNTGEVYTTPNLPNIMSVALGINTVEYQFIEGVPYVVTMV